MSMKQAAASQMNHVSYFFQRRSQQQETGIMMFSSNTAMHHNLKEAEKRMNQIGTVTTSLKKLDMSTVRQIEAELKEIDLNSDERYVYIQIQFFDEH